MIATEVSGDAGAVVVAGSALSDIADLLGTVAAQLTTAGDEADDAWDGFRAQMVLQRLGDTQRDCHGFAEQVDALATAVTAFGQALCAVADDLAQIRSSASMAGLIVGPTAILCPASDYSIDPAAQLLHAERVESWQYLTDRAEAVRAAEAAAHATVSAAIAAFISHPAVIRALERSSYFVDGPPVTVSGVVRDLGGGTAIGGAKWAARLKLGRYGPRGAGGLFRDVRRPSYREGWNLLRDDYWVAKPHQARKLGFWKAGLTATGGVIGFGTAAWDQWQHDAGRTAIGTPERAVRATVVGATTMSGNLAGTAAGIKGGATVGLLIGGPAGAVVGGFVGGVLGGIGGSHVGGWIGKHLKAPLGRLFGR